MAPKQESSDADNLDSLWLIYKLNVILSMYVWEKTACTEFSTTHAYRHPPGSWITSPVDRGTTVTTQVALGCTRLISWLQFLICCQLVLDMRLRSRAPSSIGRSSDRWAQQGSSANRSRGSAVGERAWRVHDCVCAGSRAETRRAWS